MNWDTFLLHPARPESKANFKICIGACLLLRMMHKLESYQPIKLLKISSLVVMGGEKVTQTIGMSTLGVPQG